ncbi:MAG: hypothetical protein BMS9Abin11_1340 [Gammaproteobacteria bacterium]|nr:MAG: hypothetical protein BMS9Abin11_1340 [Gammaproteobacteria bacterium]
MRLMIVLLLLFWSGVGTAASLKKQEFVLYQQTRPNIYSVGFAGKNREPRWYQLEWKVLKDGKVVIKTCDVFYDALSRNFYCTRNGRVTLLPMKRPYRLIFDKSHLKK